jgi:hypothetical protein
MPIINANIMVPFTTNIKQQTLPNSNVPLPITLVTSRTDSSDPRCMASISSRRRHANDKLASNARRKPRH